MKRLISFATAAALTFSAVPAFARTMDSMKADRKVEVRQNVKREIKKDLKAIVKRSSSRTLRNNHETGKKMTPSIACKDFTGKDRDGCVRAFQKAKAEALSNWTYTPPKSSSSSSVSSSSVSSASSTSTSTSSSSSSAASSASSN